MNTNRSSIRSRWMRRSAVSLMHAAALALAVAMAIPARADDRPIRSRIAPVYPEIAKRMKISGVVRVEVTIDPAGNVSDVKTVSGNRMLSAAAEDAVRKWKFAPGPAVSTMEMDINFALAQ